MSITIDQYIPSLDGYVHQGNATLPQISPRLEDDHELSSSGLHNLQISV